MTVTIINSPYCGLHNMDDEHPECPQRLYQINDQFIASGLDSVLHFQDAKPADKGLLELAHQKSFVDSVFEKAPTEKEERVWIDDDTIMMQHTLKAALHAAGAGRDAVDLVMSEPNQLAFCTVRPPGHHAGSSTSAGFCVFNNIAIAAKYALDKLGLERVAIIDFDVHHGDGTQDIVAGDKRICFCSSFQHPFYPYSGTEAAPDNIHNVPVPGGTKSDDYRTLVASWFTTLEAFKPQLILVSAGFDAHVEESMGYVRLVEGDYFWLAQQLKAVSDKYCEGRMIAMLEGGYALSALSRSVVAFIRGYMA